MKKKWGFRAKKKNDSEPKQALPTVPTPDPFTERNVNLITPGTHLQGKVIFDQTTRMSGHIQGQVESRPGTTLIITSDGLVEGDIQADQVIIQGFVEGEVHASSRIQITSGGRVMGNLKSPSVQVDFGAWFEGECQSGSSLSEA